MSSETRSPVWTATQQQGVVAAADPGGAVGGGEQRVDLVVGEEGDERRGRRVWAGWRAPAGSARRARGGAARRSGTASGSRPGGRCGCARCCRARVRGGRGTRRSAAASRSAMSSRGRRLAGAVAGRSRAAAGRCRGRRRWCAGWRWRWRDQPVGEERLQGRGERAHGGARRRLLEAVGGQGEQLGRGRQIPVGVRRDRRGRGRSTAAAAARATSTPSRYQPSRVCTAKLWRRSWMRGRHVAERGCSPARRDEPSRNVRWTLAVEQPGAGGGDEERRASAACGQSWSRRWPVGAQGASTVLGCSGTWRDLPNLLCRTVSSAVGRGRRRRGRGGSPRRRAARSPPAARSGSR